MNIAVLGASGGTGRRIVARAAESGHRVRAVARNPASVPPTDGAVDVVAADVLDREALISAVTDCNAVVWAVGGHDVVRTALAGRRRQPGLCAEGTRGLLHAMTKQNVPRLLVISSWGVGDSRRRLPLAFRLFVAPVMLRAELADKHRQEHLVRASDRIWTIVRPSRLTNHQSNGSYRVESQLRFASSSHTAREDLADFVVRCLNEELYKQETVEITH
ncbi:MAG: NAD(P)H-binding protein [Actinomycetota bacterium]|nr:NAD(P)H-binding protein [Actinomycetota bacterium]